MTCGTCAKDIRKEGFIDNMRELMKIHPEITWEKAYEGAMELWTLHDYSAFKVLEEEVGSDRAARLYARLWEIRSELEWPGLCKLIGKKPEDKDWTIHDVAQVMIKSFALFGNPMEIVEETEDRITLRCYDCPYTTQVIWNLLPVEEAEKYNQTIQVDCNYAIFETYLKLTGLFDQWVFNFPSQLCLTNQYCEFTFIKIKLDRTAKK